MQGEQTARRSLLRAILTDVQFWIPLVVLAMGIVLLVFIHNK
jgi:predicted RND superfamily exporter protein